MIVFNRTCGLLLVIRALVSCPVGPSSGWFESRPGRNKTLNNWNLLPSGQALGIMTVAGKLSNADASFVGVQSCCLLHSHRNNFGEDQVRAVEKWAMAFEGQLCCYCVYAVTCILAIALCKNFPQMFLWLRRSDRRECDGRHGPCM